MSKPARKIDVSDLTYYFDAKQKDCKDSLSTCTKSRKVLELRDRLMTLSDSDFELVLQTLNGLLDKRSRETDKLGEQKQVKSMVSGTASCWIKDNFPQTL